MTENELRKKFVDNAVAFLGTNERDGSHRQIIDIYNSITPLPRNYKMSYTDPWCAAFVSTVAKLSKMLSIIPAECSCYYMVEAFKKMGRWEERDDYTPTIGDIIFYDWADSGYPADNKGVPDHVGIVKSVNNAWITVIEGNYKDGVNERTIIVNAIYIRGYGRPDFASLSGETTPWYETSGEWADATKIELVDGKRPDAKATRAEVAAIVLRAIDYIFQEVRKNGQ